MKLGRALEAHAENTISRAITIARIAAPTFAEHRRAAWVDSQLRSVVVPAGGRVEAPSEEPVNVFAFLPGTCEQAPLLVSAHTDTVFPADTDLTVTGSPSDARVACPGIGDNSLAVAALLALGEALVASGPLAVPVVLVANAGEEGRGDLRGINAALDLLEERRMRPAAAIVLEGLALGRVYNQGIGVKRYEIHARGPGGHSWGDAGAPSAVHALSHLLSALAELTISAEPRSTLNIGVIEGGRSINTIADHARAELDLRSATAAGVAALEGQVQALLSAWRPRGIEREIRLIGERPAGGVGEDHPLVRAALSTARVPTRIHAGSTDANALFARRIPSVCVGITNGANAHRLDEYIETAPVAAGLAGLGALVEQAARIAGREVRENEV